MLDYEDDVTCPVCRETIAYLRSPTVVINVNNTSEENHGVGMVSLIWALFVGAALIAWLMTTMLDIADRISQRNRDLHPVMHVPFPFLHKNVTLV
jgi:hypothetical protein